MYVHIYAYVCTYIDTYDMNACMCMYMYIYMYLAAEGGLDWEWLHTHMIYMHVCTYIHVPGG